MDIFFEIAIIFSLLAIASAIRAHGSSSKNEATIEIDWGKYAPALMLGFVLIISWFLFPAVLAKVAELQAGNQLVETQTSPILTALPFVFALLMVLIPVVFVLQWRANHKASVKMAKPK
jgi:hypothetical protein